jgi:predicted SnoaL-like aldol condensation-catalyzing enzyme
MRHAHRRFVVRVGLVIAAAVAAVSPAAAHTPQEQANKQVVLDFYDALNASDAAGTTGADIAVIAETYLDPGYTQHSERLKNLPGPGTDRDKLIRMFQSMPPRPPSAGPAAMGPQKRVAVMAEGDLVMLLLQRDMVDAAGVTHANFIFNLFRVKDGKLTEHWDGASGGMGPPPGAGGAPPPGADRP